MVSGCERRSSKCAVVKEPGIATVFPSKPESGSRETTKGPTPRPRAPPAPSMTYFDATWPKAL